MELINYIRQSYRRPNRTVLKSLGATDELIEYLLHTPHNTNFNMLKQFSDSDDDNYEIVYSEKLKFFPGTTFNGLETHPDSGNLALIKSINYGETIYYKINNKEGQVTLPQSASAWGGLITGYDYDNGVIISLKINSTTTANAIISINVSEESTQEEYVEYNVIFKIKK